MRMEKICEQENNRRRKEASQKHDGLTRRDMTRLLLEEITDRGKHDGKKDEKVAGIDAREVMPDYYDRSDNHQDRPDHMVQRKPLSLEDPKEYIRRENFEEHDDRGISWRRPLKTGVVQAIEQDADEERYEERVFPEQGISYIRPLFAVGKRTGEEKCSERSAPCKRYEARQYRIRKDGNDGKKRPEECGEKYTSLPFPLLS